MRTTPMRSPILFGCLFLASCAAFAPSFAQTLQPDRDSDLKLASGELTFIDGDSIFLMDSDWKVVCNPKSAKGNARTTTTGDLVCEWSVEGGSLVRNVSHLSGGGVQVKYEFDFKKGLSGKYLELCLNIPRGCLDSMAPAGMNALTLSGPIQLESLAGILSVDPSDSCASWFLDDLRRTSWSGKFRLRLSLPYDPRQGLKASASLIFKTKPAIYSPFATIPLGQAAKRSFADDASKSGWTGQGSANDLRSMPSGLMISSGVPFEITGHACILRGANTPDFPLCSGVIPIETALKVETLCVLHTVAWGAKFDETVASYRLLYQNGSSVEVPVKYGRDINDWWMAKHPTDAKLGWTGSNGSAEIGVSLMRIANPNPASPLSGVEFVSANGASSPVLIAITALKADTTTTEESKLLASLFATRKGKPVDTSSWHECKIGWRGPIHPGSAIDFSFLNDKPAGKLGFLKRDGGSFVFEKAPKDKVRFWGTNVAIKGSYPEKEFAPDIAKCLAAQGVNLVRFHLYASSDKLLSSPDGSINSEMLDKMEFFISELEKNGIYIFMDLNDGLMYDSLLERPSTSKGNDLKYASIFDPDLKKATKLLATRLFTHINPYTGKSMADDTGICMYELINECSLLFSWGAPVEAKLQEPYISKLKDIWLSWLKANSIDGRPLPRHFNEDAVSRRFATKVQKGYLEEMAAHLRTLGVKAPISGTNITFSLGDLNASAKMDYLGEHTYWDHPGVRSRPKTYSNRAAIAQPPWAMPVISDLAKGALKGFPLVIGEWNYCFPNDMRCEGIPMAAAYAAYQDWDGMIFYCSTGSFDGGNWSRFPNTPGILIHSQQTDPATWGLSQIGAAMFRRGDVAVAGRELEVVLPVSAIEDDLMAIRKMPFLPSLGRFSISFSGADGKANWLGELALSGASSRDLYSKVLKCLGDSKSDMTHIVSDNGQIRRHSDPALLVVDTPRTQSVTGKLCDFVKAGEFLSDVKIESPMLWGSLNVTSIDGKDIPDSKRLLLVAVANARNKDTKCDPDTGLIHDMGKGPVLAEPFDASVSLRCRVASAKIFTLDPLTGERTGELASSSDGQFLSFKIDPSCKTIYFEVEAE